MNKVKLYNRVIKHFGKKHQETVAIEELSELIKVICDTFRHDKQVSEDELLSEIVDVSIMLEQLLLINHIEKENYLNMKRAKLKKLESHLN